MKRKEFLSSLAMLPVLGSTITLENLKDLTEELSTSEKMPALFLGHGSPMNAIVENEFVRNFKKLSSTISKPKAILCISAHWYTKGTKVTAMEMPKTIHDFGGFPQALYEVQYPASGSPELALETKKLIAPKLVELDETWGLDHGAWSVLKHLYPKADVPVIQLSIDYTQPPSYHFELAKTLNALRYKGVLIVGSGNIIHNLGLVDFKNFDRDNYGFDWAIEARETMNKYLLEGDFQPLLNYQNQSKAIKLAIPTPEHFLPLIYILGLKENSEGLELFNDKLLGGSLSMTSLKIA